MADFMTRGLDLRATSRAETLAWLKWTLEYLAREADADGLHDAASRLRQLNLELANSTAANPTRVS